MGVMWKVWSWKVVSYELLTFPPFGLGIGRRDHLNYELIIKRAGRENRTKVVYAITSLFNKNEKEWVNKCEPLKEQRYQQKWYIFMISQEVKIISLHFPPFFFILVMTNRNSTVCLLSGRIFLLILFLFMDMRSWTILNRRIMTDFFWRILI